MKNFFILITIIIFCSYPTYSQLVDCDCSNRYETEIFNDISVETVTYSDTFNLQMDIYTPNPDIDMCTNRPLIILAHGGSFIGGSKSNPTMVDLCETFAKSGNSAFLA